MRAAMLVVRAEARRSLWALLGLAVVVALVGAVVIAAAAGARRTSGALDRFLEDSATHDARVESFVLNRTASDALGVGPGAIAAVGLAIGIPVGTVIGRQAWTLQAESLGAVLERVTPLPAYGTLAVGVVALAVLAALIPGLRAARAHPATILRTE